LSSRATLDRDSIEDYPEIRGSGYLNPAIETRCISMVGPARVNSQNSSNKYPTIRGSKTCDARTPSNRVIRNLNLDFNILRLQTIMESIQWMVLQDSPLVALAQQGAEAVGHIIAVECSTGNHWGEPSVGNRTANQAKRARSEAASSASGNRCLADNDARRWITQNHRQQEYGHDLVDLRNIIDDRRRDRARTSSPPVVLACAGSHSIREGCIPCFGT
jgi:hypothetical protein